MVRARNIPFALMPFLESGVVLFRTGLVYPLYCVAFSPFIPPHTLSSPTTWSPLSNFSLMDLNVYTRVSGVYSRWSDLRRFGVKFTWISCGLV